MPTLHAHQVGVAALDRTLLKDAVPTVECPYCDRGMNPTGNVRTHVLKHPSSPHYVFYRTHISCALEALPHEEQLLALRAVDLADVELERLATPVH